MNLILNMSMSLNGMAARENDSTDFLAHGEWLLFVELARQTGAIVWGRKTHEIIRGYGEQVLQGFDGLVRIVISHDSHLPLEVGWQIATSPQQAIDLLTSASQAQALLGGGASLNTAFARAGLINEVVINMESVIVGCGVPLFASQDFDLRLGLLEMKQVRDEVVQLRYQVRP
jgi:dihydrofolate reductase